MSKVLIIGFGTVGHNLAEELAPLHPDIYDKYKPEHNTRDPPGRLRRGLHLRGHPPTSLGRACATPARW